MRSQLQTRIENNDIPLYVAGNAFAAHYQHCRICHLTFDPPLVCDEGVVLLKAIAEIISKLLMSDWLLVNSRALTKLSGKTFTLANLKLQREIIEAQHTRAELEARFGRVWDNEQLSREYNTLGLYGPFLVVEALGNGERGTVEFQREPRFYFNFVADLDGTYKDFTDRRKVCRR